VFSPAEGKGGNYFRGRPGRAAHIASRRVARYAISARGVACPLHCARTPRKPCTELEIVAFATGVVDFRGPSSPFEDARCSMSCSARRMRSCAGWRRAFVETIRRDAEPNRAGQRGVAQASRDPSGREHVPGPLQAHRARAMRQVLIEGGAATKERQTWRRRAIVTFDETLHASASSADELLALDEALRDLAKIQPRQATLVESRFFGGLDVAETAELLEGSESTVLPRLASGARVARARAQIAMDAAVVIAYSHSFTARPICPRPSSVRISRATVTTTRRL